MILVNANKIVIRNEYLVMIKCWAIYFHVSYHFEASSELHKIAFLKI